MSRLPRLLVGAVLITASLAPTAGALAPGQTASLLTFPGTATPIPAAANDSDLPGAGHVVSDDGQYVVFTSRADGMVADDDDGLTNVYRRHLPSGTTVLVSRATGLAGAPAASSSFDPSISANGDRVAFRTVAPLDPADSNGRSDVYVRTLSSGLTTLVSRRAGAAGLVGNDQSLEPAISGNGVFVTFVSSATNLDDDDPDTFTDVYRRNLDTGALVLVSRRDPDDAKVGSASTQPAINDSGGRIAFVTSGNLAPGAADTDGVNDVYVRLITGQETGTTTLVSLTSAGANVAGNVSEPTLAPDGLAVAFTSSAQLDPVDGDPFEDVYYRTPLSAGPTQLVSRAGLAGDDCAGICRSPMLTTVAGLDRVIYRAQGSAAITGTPDGVVVQREIGSGDQVVLSRGDGLLGPVLTSSQFGTARTDGAVAFAATAPPAAPDDGNDFSSVYLRRSALGQTELVSRLAPGIDATRTLNDSFAAIESAGHMITPDGRYALLLSDADALLPAGAEVTGYSTQLYRRDLATGAVELVSRGDGPGSAPVVGDPVEVGAISADGRYVAFGVESPALATSLGAPAEAQDTQVYRRDLLTGTTIVVSRADTALGGPAAQGVDLSEGVAMSADGNRVAFVSASPGLAPGQANAFAHVFVRDISAQSTVLASRVTGPGGSDLGGSSYHPSLSADGTRVAFGTNSDELDGDAATPELRQVVVRDLAAATTTLISRTGAGAPADLGSFAPVISADGTRVAFTSEATDLDPADLDTRDTVYVAEVAGGPPVAVGRADGAAGAVPPISQDTPRISPDGRHILFTTSAALVPTDTNDDHDAYLRDTLLGTTVRVSLGAGGEQLRRGFAAAVSRDARCVLFDTPDGSIQAGSPTSQDFGLVAVRAVAGDCPEPAPVLAPPPGPDPVTPAPAPAGPAADTTAPRLAGVAVTARRFRVRGVRVRPLPGRRLAPAGTRLRVRLSERATVRVVFQRRVAGKRVGTRCLARTRARAKRPGCIRFVAAGTVVRRGLAPGARVIVLTGRIGRRVLRPGAHRLTVTAVDAAGNRSAARRVAVTVVRR